MTYLFNCNVLAISRLDEVLLAVDELQVAVLVPLTDIAGLEPAVGRHGFGSLLRVLEVAAHDIVSSDPDLALVVRSEVTSFEEVNKLDVRAAGDASERVVCPF